MMNCDVLVIGASPAGITASISAAGAGSDVILMDRDLGRLDHAANTVFEGMALRAGLLIDDSYVLKTVRGMRILSPAGRAATISAPGYFIDRNKFDDYHLGKATDAGATLLQDTADDIRIVDGGRLVATSKGDIAAKVVVDASGVKSALGAKAGLSPMRHPEDIAWAMEATVQHPGIGDEEYFQYWIGSMAPGWKATFSPGGGDRATLGVFVRGRGEDVRPFFRRFLNLFKQYKLKAYRNIEDMKILTLRRGGDPIAVLPGEIVSDGLMIVGGAAGESGLAYSMRAGTICGTVAAQAVSEGDFSREALSEYERRWRSEFYWEYRMGRAALQTIRGMSDVEIDRLVQDLSNKDLILNGPLYKKAIDAGMKVASVKPGVMIGIILNLARG
jgi:digeranylgeranylglycerophospholipid reductase